jgi:type VI secretion system protein ImpM
VSESVATGALGRGFYGKLPVRGDFLRNGLPRSFADPWDAWLQAAIGASRSALGEDWLESWMEAPVWRFALPDGACGPAAVLGLWMPSIDRAGRHFPLTLGLLVPGAAPEDLAIKGSAWLDAAEQAGRDALASMGAPEDLAARLDTAPTPTGVMTTRNAGAQDTGDAVWWTAGSPFVPPATLRLRGLPDPACFAQMIRVINKVAAPNNNGVEAS